MAANQDCNPTIEHLIEYIQKSNLTFIRNGKEHDSVNAAEHITDKYNYFKSSITSPEEFIDQTATKSSFSGRPYLIKLPDGQEIPVKDWLLTELQNYRKQNSKNR